MPTGGSQQSFECLIKPCFSRQHLHVPPVWPLQVTESSTAVNAASFSNTGNAFITNWQIVTLSGWNFIMFRTIDNSSPFAGIYFISLVIIGAYCVVRGERCLPL